MNYQALDDQELMGYIARAHPDALTELYDRYGRLVFSIAFNVMRTRQTAEEITLDVFQKVWDRAETYQADRGRVVVWISTLARNRSIDVLRREGSRLDHQAVGWSDLVVSPAAATPTPEAATQLAMQKRRVAAAVATLPEAQRHVLTLAFFQGFTHREIAEQTGVPLGTVKTRIRSALHKLQNLLRDEQIQTD